MSSNKNKLIEMLGIQIRQVSANSVMFSQTVAEKVGINSTDNECIDFLLIHGPLTAGKLAELTGLTTGSVTAMIDRLEKSDYAKREADKNDRRKIVVVPNKEKIFKEIVPLTMSMGDEFVKLTQEFSERELEVILKFITKANKISIQETAKLIKK